MSICCQYYCSNPDQCNYSSQHEMTHGVQDERAKEFISGLFSAIVSVSVTYPITKLIYRQILEKATIQVSVSKMKKDGIRRLYRGMLSPLLQRSAEISIMFGIYKSAEMALHPLNLRRFDEKTASSAISGFAKSLLAPLERTELLLIDSRHHDRFKNMGQAVFIIMRDYGPREFYRGYTVILARDIIHNTLFFFAREKIYGMIKSHNVIRIVFEDFLIGSGMGLFMTTLFYPIKVIKANMQKELGSKFKSVFEVTREVYYYEGRGIRNFYTGIGMNILRAMVGWGIVNVSYEFIKYKL